MALARGRHGAEAPRGSGGIGWRRAHTGIGHGHDRTRRLTYCQYCEFYDEYAQLGTKAQGGAAQTEAERLRRSAKARSGGFVGSKPFESRWDQEEVCSVHFRPVECAEKPLGAKDLGPPGGEICAACPPAAEGAAADEKAITELIDENNRFASCPDAEIAKSGA